MNKWKKEKNEEMMKRKYELTNERTNKRMNVQINEFLNGRMDK